MSDPTPLLIARRPAPALFRTALRTVVLTLAIVAGAAPTATAQSQAGSEAASGTLSAGSANLVEGSAEVLSGTAALTVTSVTATRNGFRLVVRPVATGVSAAADLTLDISQAAWDAAGVAAHASGRASSSALVAAGDVIETVSIKTSRISATASQVGTMLVIGGSVVLAVIAHEALEAMLGHEAHACLLGHR